MTQVTGRVTILPEQVRRLAALSELQPVAIEVVQDGSSTLRFNNGFISVEVDSRGNDIPPPNQDTLC
jgi:hypothetical protein